MANLDAALLDALRRAATDAAGDGVEVFVDSGWRSPAYQEQLLREAVAKYGSEREAARWVATPNTSAHVSGDAVDIGPADATAWLARHGAGYELCQIYGNEPWHYELRPARRRSRLPAHVRRPDARSEDAAVTGTLGLTVYGCEPDEADLFDDLAPRFGVVPTMTSAAVSETNRRFRARQPLHQCGTQVRDLGGDAARA